MTVEHSQHCLFSVKVPSQINSRDGFLLCSNAGIGFPVFLLFSLRFFPVFHLTRKCLTFWQRLEVIPGEATDELKQQIEAKNKQEVNDFLR